MACSSVSRILKTCPRADETTIKKCLKVWLMDIRQPIHRRTYRHFDALRRDSGGIETRISSRHLRGGNGELAEAARHSASRARHPLLDIKVTDFTYDLALAGQLRRVEDSGGFDARTAVTGGLPKILDADTNRRDDPKASNHRPSIHWAPLRAIRPIPGYGSRRRSKDQGSGRGRLLE